MIERPLRELSHDIDRLKSPWEGVLVIDVIVNGRIRRPRTLGRMITPTAASAPPPYATSWRWLATTSIIGNSASVPPP
jgi:hypothetical protein